MIRVATKTKPIAQNLCDVSGRRVGVKGGQLVVTNSGQIKVVGVNINMAKDSESQREGYNQPTVASISLALDADGLFEPVNGGKHKSAIVRSRTVPKDEAAFILILVADAISAHFGPEARRLVENVQKPS